MVHRLGSGAGVVGMRHSAGVGGRSQDGAEATVSGIRGNSGPGGIGAKPMGGDPGASRVGRGGVFGGLEEADSRGCPRAKGSAAVEWVKGEKWVEFRDRHGDRGRDLVLYLGRRLCGLKLKELAAAVGLPNYSVVATNTKRYEQRLQSDRTDQAQMKAVAHLLNCEM